jgi:hypothetical protein
VCEIIKGVAGRTRQGIGRHQPVSMASQQERTGGSILCCILLPLWPYMVCVPSAWVLPLNSSSLLSVPDDLACEHILYRSPSACLPCFLQAFPQLPCFLYLLSILTTFLCYHYFSNLHILSSMQTVLLRDSKGHQTQSLDGGPETSNVDRGDEMEGCSQ